MELTSKKIAVLGAGNMGIALVRGLIDAGTPPTQIVITNKRPERSQALARQYGVEVARSNADAVVGADIVLLAVKPQIFSKVTSEISGRVGSALVISVAAGIPIERIERELSSPRVIRSMPNTPAVVKEGATAISPGTHASEDDMRLAKEIFELVGQVVVLDESLLDAVTGLSGSGPAYVFLIIESFCDAGVKVGLSREIATDLAVQTIRGAATMMQKTKEHPGRLKDQVTSPGGTAIAGIASLEEGGLRTTIIRAVEAATKRARELGNG